MSAEMDSNTEIHQVLVRLLDEGTDVFRPALAEFLGENYYKLLPTQDYDPEIEAWEFLPGTVVCCEVSLHSGEPVLIASRRAD